MNMIQELVSLLQERNYRISTAESVTGGKIISSIIDIPGASKVTEESFIVYSNSAKINVLGIDKNLIDKFGVVSEEVAKEMAKLTKEISNADIIISTTGEAGPILNDDNIQVGTVCFGLIFNDNIYSYKKIFSGNRIDILNSARDFILNELYIMLN
jgi:nicotinamide-nucleotide amidase